MKYFRSAVFEDAASKTNSKAAGSNRIVEFLESLII